MWMIWSKPKSTIQAASGSRAESYQFHPFFNTGEGSAQIVTDGSFGLPWTDKPNFFLRLVPLIPEERNDIGV